MTVAASLDLILNCRVVGTMNTAEWPNKIEKIEKKTHRKQKK